jgi:hypothetical protein
VSLCEIGACHTFYKKSWQVLGGVLTMIKGGLLAPKEKLEVFFFK